MRKPVAIALGKSEFWENLNPIELVWFQLNEPLVCVPFDVFQKAVSEALDRPVSTHELGGDHLLPEFIAKHGEME